MTLVIKLPFADRDIWRSNFRGSGRFPGTKLKKVELVR